MKPFHLTRISFDAPSLEASSGSILYGAVDTAKFTNELLSVPLIPTEVLDGILSTDNLSIPSNISYTYSDFSIPTTAFSVISTSGTDVFTGSNYSTPALIDVGYYGITLPNYLYTAVLGEFNAFIDSNGATLVSCDLFHSNGTINFQFAGPDGPTIQLPVSYLISSTNETADSANHDKACTVEINSSGDNEYGIVLGQIFLRAAYAVFDIDNARVALVQANPDVTQSNIVLFTGPNSTIPQVTRDLDYNVSYVDGSSISRQGLNFTAEPGFTSSGVPFSYVGLGNVVMVVVVGCVFLWV